LQPEPVVSEDVAFQGPVQSVSFPSDDVPFQVPVEPAQPPLDGAPVVPDEGAPPVQGEQVVEVLGVHQEVLGVLLVLVEQVRVL